MLERNDELSLDRLIHEPGRLAILTVLSSAKALPTAHDRADQGNVSSHLAKLEEAGLVEIQKRFVGKKPNTNVALTPVGKQRIARHWDQLERLKRLSEHPFRAKHRPRPTKCWGEACGLLGYALATVMAVSERCTSPATRPR